MTGAAAVSRSNNSSRFAQDTSRLRHGAVACEHRRWSQKESPYESCIAAISSYVDTFVV